MVFAGEDILGSFGDSEYSNCSRKSIDTSTLLPWPPNTFAVENARIIIDSDS